MGRYEFLEAVTLADCAVEIEGRSLDDLFETAAAAIARLMVDPATLTTTVERAISLEASELDMLVDTLHRLDISRRVVSLKPIGNIKG